MPTQPMTPTCIQLQLDDFRALFDRALQPEAGPLRNDAQRWLTKSEHALLSYQP